MSKDRADYTVTNARTLSSLQAKGALPSSKPASVRLGSITTPLLNIEPDHIIPDELHLLLHIADVLITHLQTIVKTVVYHVQGMGSKGSRWQSLRMDITAGEKFLERRGLLTY